MVSSHDVRTKPDASSSSVLPHLHHFPHNLAITIFVSKVKRVQLFITFEYKHEKVNTHVCKQMFKLACPISGYFNATDLIAK